MRRRLLIFAIALAWLAACGGQSSGPLNPAAPIAGEEPGVKVWPNNVNELPEPPVVRAVNGIARMDLQANLNPANGMPSFSYKGQHGVTPTLRVNPGETIVVNIVNDLPLGPGDKYWVNLHFHGFGSSPMPPGDDVLGMVARQGESLHYVVHVPANQQPGLYWYHTHIHGHVNFQVGEAGMSGAIVVNGLDKHYPALANMRERVIVMRDIGISKTLGPQVTMDGMTMDPIRPKAINSNPCGPDIGLTPELNGAYRPVITIAPGEKQFFRVINSTGHKTLKLAVDGTELELIAIDGYALDTYPGSPATRKEPYAIIPPAGRAEFVVTGPKSPIAKFRTECYDSGIGGDRDPNLILASIVHPKGHDAGQRSSDPGPLTVGAPLPDNYYTRPLPPPKVKRTVVFSEDNVHFFINHKIFSPNAPPMYVVHVGTVEEWHILNTSQEVHAFHIHQIHFVVKAIDGKKLVHPYWADTQIIPHRQADGKPGTLDLLMDFLDPRIKGMFVFHCHILDHEDHGMMAKIEAI